MADRYHYHNLPLQKRDFYDDRSRPQLPNFENFVRAAGQPGLADRLSIGREYVLESPTPPGHPSLPTPPPTNASRPTWDGGLLQHQAWSPVEHLVNHQDRPVPTLESTRRASFALPIQSRPQPRPARAYSSTNPERSYRDFTGGPNGQVIYEEYAPERNQYYRHDLGESGPSESPGEIIGSIWGVTKAGKPRKRLSQACSTCREKKIKCDPGYGTKCSQCLRFNRECRFGTNPRQGHKSSKFRASAHSPDAKDTRSPNGRLSSRRSSIATSDVSNPTDVVQPRTSPSSTSADEALVLSPTMSDRPGSDAPTPSKRQRVCVDSPDRLGENNAHQHELSRRNINAHTYHLGYSAETDPIRANEKLTKIYLDLFMDYINIPTFEVFPQRYMLEWAHNEAHKSAQDRTVVYAMMALATVHSTDPRRMSHRALFKSIIYQQLDQMETEYSLQVAHTLLFLAFVEFADAMLQKGFSLFVRMVGCIAFLRMNIEHDTLPETTAYNMSPTMFAECRRRTFWTAYVTDTYAALSKGDPRIMHTSDIFLRLPCASEQYEKDEIPDLPIFDQEYVLSGIPPTEQLLQMADMVHLIQIATVCSDIQMNSWRCRNVLRIGREYSQDRTIRANLEKRLETWSEIYNTTRRAKESRANYADSYTGGKESGSRTKRYAGLDILYHYAHMELNRRVYHKPMDKNEMLEHAKKANEHAIDTLKLTQQLLKQGGSDTKDYLFATRGPLGGYAVHTAIDIITAVGSITDILAPQSSIMTLMWGGSELLEHLSAWWGSAHIQHLQVKERIQTVFSLCQAALYDHKTYFYCSDPMSSGSERDFDMIYGMPRAQYLRGAYELNKVKESDIFEIDTREKEQKLVVS